ncbi:hypothetical protein [Sagittula sp. S175]|uniref:hypothetical protein n=1 Tax=Sagittula sp. S175 TaxID=3415129 RepID=UPI003C7A3238
MDYFTNIPGATALVHSRGVYRQTALYARGDAIYAKHGAGYIRIGIGGATSAPNIRWAEFDQGDTATIIEKPGAAPKLASMGDVREAAE